MFSLHELPARRAGLAWLRSSFHGTLTLDGTLDVIMALLTSDEEQAVVLVRIHSTASTCDRRRLTRISVHQSPSRAFTVSCSHSHTQTLLATTEYEYLVVIQSAAHSSSYDVYCGTCVSVSQPKRRKLLSSHSTTAHPIDSRTSPNTHPPPVSFRLRYPTLFVTHHQFATSLRLWPPHPIHLYTAVAFTGLLQDQSDGLAAGTPIDRISTHWVSPHSSPSRLDEMGTTRP